MSKTTKQSPRVTVQNCSVVNEGFKPDQHYLEVVRALAYAAEENAKAIAVVAARMAGPEDRRVGIKISGDVVEAAKVGLT